MGRSGMQKAGESPEMASPANIKHRAPGYELLVTILLCRPSALKQTFLRNEPEVGCRRPGNFFHLSIFIRFSETTCTRCCHKTWTGRAGRWGGGGVGRWSWGLLINRNRSGMLGRIVSFSSLRNVLYLRILAIRSE